MKKFSILCTILLATSASMVSQAAPNQESKSVVYYADPNHQAETQKVLEECKSRIKTVFDYEIVMSQENCKNAQIGEIAAFRKQQRDEIQLQKQQTEHVGHTQPQNN